MGLVAWSASAHAAGSTLVINEVYGGGGNSGAEYTHDFVELYNGTGADIDLTGYVVQYYSASGNAGPATNTCTLSGTIPAGGHFLIQQAQGAGGTTALPTPDQVCAAAMAGANGSVRLFDAAAATIDTVGYGTATIVEVAAAPALSNTTSASRTDGIDTDNNAADFTAGAPSPQNSGAATEPEPEPEVRTVTIAEIQGTGPATPIPGERVITDGVVTAAYPSGGFRGVYLQTPGTGGVAKVPGDASDGIFVFSDWAAENLAIGDCVQVEGTAGEFNGLTQLSGNPVVTIVAAGCAPVAPTPLPTLPATDEEKEVYEGMLVLPLGTYTITNNYQTNQFGQVGLALGDAPLYTATEVVRPGPEAVAYEAENLRRYITLDDGSSWNLMTNNTARNTYALPYLSHETPMRTASQVTFTDPVILDYRFQWNYQPISHVHGHDHPAIPVAAENDRPQSAPSFGDDLVIGAFNVLNYFDDLGQDEEGCAAYSDREGNPVATDFCIVRGAYSTAAFADQEAKLVAAINSSGADVLALMEIETSSQVPYRSHDRDRTLATLVAALNVAAGSERWAVAPSPLITPTNEDIIRTAFIYNPQAVELGGAAEILMDPAFADAREPLAQKFIATRSGADFVMIANHFKSKGSGEDDGTGQGNANPSREAQSAALTAWANDRFADDAVFLSGDFNAYSMETPMQIMEAGGYTNVAKAYEPSSATYQFSGRLGSLDHILGNEAAMALVTGAAVWDINGDESIAFQYSRRNYNVVDYHRDDAFASSDHDPLFVGLRNEAPTEQPSPEPTQEPTQEPTPRPTPTTSRPGPAPTKPGAAPTGLADGSNLGAGLLFALAALLAGGSAAALRGARR
ncbi:MAG: ExeM/NucH family extracellular endonuclease [Actinomycetia bacterium]|nr:ExeM/NucH family extracellular endonuclease [Actinomycetes bacterium]